MDPNSTNPFAGLAQSLAEVLSVPYYTDRELGRQDYPECFMNVDQALERLGDKGIVGVYAHMPSLNLVIVTEDDKIGIRSNCLGSGFLTLVKTLSLRKPPVEA
jgi:hypothetical protein